MALLRLWLKVEVMVKVEVKAKVAESEGCG